jgi:hypothetical protein
MPLSESLTNTDPLDLLRRFIPTPFKGTYQVDLVCVTVQTNDLTLLPALLLTECMDLPQRQPVEWKLVRDQDSNGVLDLPRTFGSGPLTFVEMGTACFFGLDHERREILGFISTRIDARTYQDLIVPLLCQMTRETCAMNPQLGLAGLIARPAND